MNAYLDFDHYIMGRSKFLELVDLSCRVSL